MQPPLVPVWGLGSPAAVEVGRCHRILIDPLIWPLIPRGQRDFILAHEKAHCAGAASEIEADAQALEVFLAQGGHPQDALRAITDNLDMRHAPNQVRARLIQQQTAVNPLVNPLAPAALVPHRSQLQYFGGYDPWTPTWSDAADAPSNSGNALGNNDTSGWEADDWINLFEKALGAAPAIIGSTRGRTYVPPGAEVPPPQSSFNPNLLLVIGGGILLLVVLFLILRR